MNSLYTKIDKYIIQFLIDLSANRLQAQQAKRKKQEKNESRKLNRRQWWSLGLLQRMMMHDSQSAHCAVHIVDYHYCTTTMGPMTSFYHSLRNRTHISRMKT